MAQHGIVRHRRWRLRRQGHRYVSFSQDYVALSPVRNTKLPVPLGWPFSFAISKRYTVRENTFTADFSISNKSGIEMPYALGWHPAFKTFGGVGEPEGWFLVQQNNKVQRITLEAVVKASQHGAMVLDSSNIVYTNGARTIEVASDFGTFMLWSPKGSEMVCIEPTTAHPRWEGVKAEDMKTMIAHSRRKFRVNISVVVGATSALLGKRAEAQLSSC